MSNLSRAGYHVMLGESDVANILFKQFVSKRITPAVQILFIYIVITIVVTPVLLLFNLAMTLA